MFGLGRKRKTFDFEVTSTLQQVLKIDTDNQTNKRFPGYLVYMDLLDAAWHSKKNGRRNCRSNRARLLGGCHRERPERRALERLDGPAHGARANPSTMRYAEPGLSL